MNAEQLYAICKELKEEISSANLLGRLQRLEQALQQSISQPNQSEFQQQIGQLRKELTEALTAIEQEDRPVVKRQIIDEIGGTNLLGGELLNRINNSFTQIDVTPSLVHSDITQMRSELEDFTNGLDELIAGFNRFGIGAEELAEYTAELGVLIPRRENAEDLAFFAKDIGKLDRELQVFSELVTGKAERFKIRSISSSDFSVFIEVLPETAKVIVGTIGVLLLAYDKLLDIRKKRSELREQDAPPPVVEELDKWAESLMQEKVNEVTSDLMEQFKEVDRPGGRVKEIEGHVRLSLKKIAGRLDVGYHFSARIGEVPGPDDEEDEDAAEETARKAEVVRAIKEDASKMQLRKMLGDPVLPLTWQPDANEEEVDDGK